MEVLHFKRQESNYCLAVRFVDQFPFAPKICVPILEASIPYLFQTVSYMLFS